MGREISEADYLKNYVVERATPADIPAMITLEKRANQMFRAIGYDFVGDAEVTDAEEHAAVMRDGATFVARAPAAVAGFAMFTRLDGEAHLDEIDVDPDFQRRGLARRLIAAGENWARAENYGAMTLTTYRDVAWNAPFYRRLGFVEFAPGPERPALLALIEKEATWGSAKRPRIAMRKPL